MVARVRSLVVRGIATILISLLAAVTPVASQAPPSKLSWILKRAEIHVRQAGGETQRRGRYLVESYLDLVPPPEAHPQVDPGALTLWFEGDEKRQALKIEFARINGKDVLTASSPHARGTQVGLHIEYANRVAPLAVHFMVALNAEAGRVALPVADRHEQPAIEIRRPDGTVWRPAGQAAHLVVDKTAVPEIGIPVGVITAGALVALALGAVIVVLVLRRRRAGTRAGS